MTGELGMNGNEEDTRVNLENSLSRLYQLLDRIEKAQANYDQVLMRYLKPEQELKKPFGKKRIRIGILAWVLVFVVSYALYSISKNDLILAFVGLIAGIILVAAFLKFLKDQEILPRSLVILMLSAAAALIVGSVTVLTGDESGGYLLAIGLLVLVYVPFRMYDARLPYINGRIQRRNQDAHDAAYQAASSELVPIEQEISAVQRLYRDGNYSLWFPEKYLDTASVSAIWNIVHDHRASNIQEAINQYVQDLHNQFMRDAAQQQIVEQQRNTRATQIASVMNIGMQAFQGAATREAINTPRTVRVEKGW